MLRAFWRLTSVYHYLLSSLLRRFNKMLPKNIQSEIGLRFISRDMSGCGGEGWLEGVGGLGG